MIDHTLRKDLLSIIGVIVALSIISATVVLLLTDQALTNQKQDILEQKTTTLNALASRFQLRIDDATNALEVVKRHTEFSKVDNPEMVSEEFRGIPIGLEEDKRKIVRDTLEEYRIFETIAFVLPNGDIYFVEPYDRQLSLPRLNFADRDWYREPVKTGMPFAADALISTATNNRVIPIGVPVHAPDGTLTGIIVGAVNLELLENQLRMELNLANNNRVIYVDDKGNAIEDISSEKIDTYSSIKSMNHLQSVRNVIGGASGHIVEIVDDYETLTVYRSIDIDGHSWGVLVMQPISNAYSAIDYLRNQSYTMLVIILAMTAGSGYFLVSFRIHSTLARQLEKANSELIEREKVKDEFLKIASHELKTPIQPILGYSSLAVRGLVQEAVAWKVVHREAQRLMKLANNIVDVTVIQSGIASYDLKKTSIVEIIRTSVDAITNAATAKGLALELNVDDSCTTIEINADRSRLKRVFDELLDNCVKFTSKGGIKVNCKMIAGGEQMLISFQDTGSSIEEEMLPKIFDIFSTNSVDDASTQGAGLGLFICEAIVKAHNGSIVARNIGDGAGVVFEIRLPIASKQFEGKQEAAAN